MKTHKHPSQSERILSWLQRGRKITSLRALRLFGCLNLKGRAHDIKKAGYPIDKKWVKTESGKRVAEYYMKKAA